MFQDQQAFIIVKFINEYLMQQAHHTVILEHQDLTIQIVKDLRQLLSNNNSHITHSSRNQTYLFMEEVPVIDTDLRSIRPTDADYTYCLCQVPLFLK